MGVCPRGVREREDHTSSTDLLTTLIADGGREAVEWGLTEPNPPLSARRELAREPDRDSTDDSGTDSSCSSSELWDSADVGRKT